MKISFYKFLVGICGLSALLLFTLPVALFAAPEVPVKGMVTKVGLGAKKSIPCKMMASIMEELEKEYNGKAAIVFIDVWENPAEVKKYRIRSIPTQIFYDIEGKEVYRHEGFFDKASIVAKLEQLGVKK
ncbi:MAG: thioredoxin family protein [Syntrophales bacterium LBB04]|nr:thioredoxin family protein [Syntrophales bacterium LBB04]